MKKTLLSAMFLGMAAFAFAQESTILFQDDFEWLEPWSCQKPAGRTVEDNNPDATAQQLGTNKVDDVSTYQALLGKGYEIIAVCEEGKEPRKPEAQSYLQRNYLKFGLTAYYSGLVLPTMKAAPAGSTATISFDWSSQRRGETVWDPTALVVIVKNGTTEQHFLVPTHEYADGDAYLWISASVELKGATIDENTRITIRNIDEQWPSTGGNKCRWFIDNINVTAVAGGAAVNEVAVDNNAPAEYFNILGIRVENPTNGLYIVRKGNKVSRVIVK